ncbi:beta-N-acetylhexosaminidase [Actinospica robiniae]|uniref:beta-N-acetylhexosaminidase n=1 Tax=Actinospica robiniae TaxID=304901 RepID=UPI0004217E6C|nr:beta-N-acetylhexosaminidase [Actinospica robiniae]
MLLPRPARSRTGTGAFTFDPSTSLTAQPPLAGLAHWLQGALRPATGLPLPITAGGGSIRLQVDPVLGAEAYRLEVEPERITVTGGDAAGAFYGCQAVRQLLPPAIYRRALVSDADWRVPAVLIEDAPRFRWRGVMLDVARHFMPTRDVLRFIDLMAVHRLNTLHLHLTDDQGWRIEIQRYPKLAEIGSWRRESQLGAAPDSPGDGRPHGGCYTRQDIREIVAYAAERHIVVVPEIDLPGHSEAAIAAYPELGTDIGRDSRVRTRWGISTHLINAEESTIDFFRDVLDEVMELFPSPYIGLGGDECPKDGWRADPRTQQLIRERGLDGEEGLQGWILGELGRHVTSRGRRVFGWDELLEGEVPGGTVIASWRGMTGARTAARRGYDVVACPDDQVYLDYRQSELAEEPIPVGVPVTVEDVYAFDPVPEELTGAEAARILGGQANIWTEHMDSPRTVDYFAYPRLCALAEALWSEGGRDFAEFSRRLAQHLPRLDALGVEYRRAQGPRPWQRRPGIAGQPATRAEWAEFIDSLVAGIKS